MGAAATIVVPMFFASILNTLVPDVFHIGPMTAAIASKEGLNALIDVTLVATGSQLIFRRLRLN